VQGWANEWLKKENVMVSNRKLVSANSRVVQKFVKVVREKKKDKLLEMLQAEEQEAAQENRKPN
jgi:superfamily II DNA/RNA helicase